MNSCFRGKFPPVRVRVWFRVSVRNRVWGQFSSGAIVLEPFVVMTLCKSEGAAQNSIHKKIEKIQRETPVPGSFSLFKKNWKKETSLNFRYFKLTIICTRNPWFLLIHTQLIYSNNHHHHRSSVSQCRSSHQWCSIKKLFLKILQYLRVSF